MFGIVCRRTTSTLGRQEEGKLMVKMISTLIVVCGTVATIVLLKDGQIEIAFASGGTSFALAAEVLER